MEKAKLIPLILLLALAGAGCSSSKTDNGGDSSTDTTTPVVVDPTPPSGTGDSTDSSVTGYGTNSVQFIPVSYEEMNSYVATHPLNAPSNFKVTVDLTAKGSSRYAGTVKLSYDDNGIHYVGVFDSGSNANPDLSYSPYNGSDGWWEYAFNYWMSSTIFSGYFQDAYGAIVLIVDGTTTTNQGDGQGGEAMLTGSVWYRNFAQSQAPQGPSRKCWFITTGPYNCQSNIVNKKSATNYLPTDTYRKLGTFTGLARSQAFHN